MTNAQTTAAETLSAERLLCLGFAAPDDSALLQQLSASRKIIAMPTSEAKYAVLAKSGEIGAALALAVSHAESIEALVLLAPSKAEVDQTGDGLAEVKAQVLVLAGTRDAEGCEAATAFKRKRAASHLVYVYDAASDMDTERPEAVAKVTLDFLTRRDKFLVSNADGRITR